MSSKVIPLQQKMQERPVEERPAITVDLSGLKIGDLRRFGRFQDGSATPGEMVDFLDRIVVGGVEELPLTSLNDVVAEVARQMSEQTNPQGAEGN